MSDTIAAIATGSGLSAIGIVRVSGDGTLEAVDRVFRPVSGEPMSRRENRRLVYGALLNESGQTLDLCLCTVSRGPGSYTGEDTAELQCHGSPAVLRGALKALFAAGARQALPGEFTKRAFLNGRLDLTAAEAVADIIAAQTEEAALNAAGQLGGAVLRRTEQVYSDLADISAHYHAVIDYPDEDIDEFALENYISVLDGAEAALKRLLDSFERGSVVVHGLPAAILGRPNTGKSTLFNALLGYDRAIVTDMAGTTRDTIAEPVRLGRVLLRLCDTAGIRDADSDAERQGVRRSRQAMEEAGLVLVLADASAPLSSEDWDILRAVRETGKPWIFVPNKTDLTGNALSREMAAVDAPCVVPVSAKTGAGLPELEQAVAALFPPDNSLPGEMLTNARQAEAVSRALASLRQARRAMDGGITPDAVLTETESAMAALGELTGRTVREDVTERIFARFCVGK